MITLRAINDKRYHPKDFILQECAHMRHRAELQLWNTLRQKPLQLFEFHVRPSTGSSKRASLPGSKSDPPAGSPRWRFTASSRLIAKPPRDV
jgi:hypothetical protein